MKENYVELREQAILWINSERDFNAGVALLEQTSFRPGVVNVLKRKGNKAPQASERLVHLMRSFIKAWASEQNEDTDLELGVLNGKPMNESLGNIQTSFFLTINELATKIDAGTGTDIPEPIIELVKKYREAYVRREIAHREMAELGEENTPEICELRVIKSEEIEDLSNLMDKIYPLYKTYIEENKLPDQDMKLNTEKPEGTKNNADDKQLVQNYNLIPTEELKRIKKSLATKSLRARNRLDYQQETKAEEPNPLPQGPERLKYETKIANLAAEIEKIDYAIAAKG